jgi:amino acid adenylation domain-containing protein
MNQEFTKSVCSLLEEQAIENPHAIAVTEGYRRLNYAELNGRANQLAHLLREQVAGPDAIVGLCMRRSLEFVIAALGIWKSGAAYLPLDPEYPGSRLAMLLNDSGTRFAVTDSTSGPRLPEGSWQSVTLDATGKSTARYPRANPGVKCEPENLAYVIYTSGSTGRPKGVQITHSNLRNLVCWHQRAFSVSRADHATFHASPAFDAGVWELWPYLASGACVHVVDERVRTTPDTLRDWLLKNEITISFLPTTLAQQMLDLQWPCRTPLRVLLTGADTLHRFPPAGLPFAFVNNYGPTECTVVATSGTVPVATGVAELPTIGMPIDNTCAYIVDEQLREVEAGTAGELLIGGAGVGRGYLNLPALTAERFIPDHFSSDPKSRLYRTGDLVRSLPTGEIAFLGRIDDQIKIRGHRIEPQEIAVVLNDCAGVESSIVVGLADEYGDKNLVAYIVAKPTAELKASVLRTALAEHLPNYMIPSAFVRLEKLPISANGKLDYAALPAPVPDDLLRDQNYEAPESELQERLAAMVAQLLKVDRVGMEDNFFNLGGHSLLGAQLIVHINAVFGVEVSLLSVFNDPTVRGISAEVERLLLEKVDGMSEDEALRLLSAQDLVRK